MRHLVYTTLPGWKFKMNKTRGSIIKEFQHVNKHHIALQWELKSGTHMGFLRHRYGIYTSAWENWEGFTEKMMIKMSWIMSRWLADGDLDKENSKQRGKVVKAFESVEAGSYKRAWNKCRPKWTDKMLRGSHKSEQVVRCGYVMGQENSEVDSKSRLHSLKMTCFPCFIFPIHNGDNGRGLLPKVVKQRMSTCDQKANYDTCFMKCEANWLHI